MAVWGFNNVRGDPHLYRSATARRGADGGPTNEWTNFVIKESEREVRRRPAYRCGSLALSNN